MRTKRIDPNSIFVFLGGCTNSGTGLFRMLLGKHPSVSVLPLEGPNVTTLLPNDDRCGLPRRLFALNPEVYRLTEADLWRFEFDKILNEWAEHWNTERQVLFEKCPANAIRMRLLQAAVPKSSFIGLIRDPHAVCEGIRRRRGHDLRDCARQWVEANRIMLEDAANLKKFVLIRYEDLAASPKSILNKACSFIGIEPFSFNENEILDRQNITNSPQPIQNMNQLSLQALATQEVQLINEVCWPFAQRFGYWKKNPR